MADMVRVLVNTKVTVGIKKILGSESTLGGSLEREHEGARARESARTGEECFSLHIILGKKEKGDSPSYQLFLRLPCIVEEVAGKFPLRNQFYF